MSEDQLHDVQFDPDYYSEYGSGGDTGHGRYRNLYKKRPSAHLLHASVRVLLFVLVLLILCVCFIHSESGAATRLAGALRFTNGVDVTAAATSRQRPRRASDTHAPALAETPPLPAEDDLVVSLQQACAHEMNLYCANRRSNRLQCLLQHHYTTRANEAGELWRRYSDVCLSWLEARDACVTFVRLERRSLCRPDAQNARECLRRVLPDLLPPLCVKSDYYRSVRMVSHLRRHHTI